MPSCTDMVHKFLGFGAGGTGCVATHEGTRVVISGGNRSRRAYLARVNGALAATDAHPSAGSIMGGGNGGPGRAGENVDWAFYFQSAFDGAAIAELSYRPEGVALPVRWFNPAGGGRGRL